VTLAITLANAGVTKGDRPKDRTETHLVGATAPAYDPFSFCCYRALLLGHPAAITRAVLRPGGRRLLTEPLSPQPLLGEETVAWREWSCRKSLLFRLQSGGFGHTTRRVFGYRHSDGHGPRPWLRYQPDEVVLDPATGAPPTFADAEDFRRKVQVLGPGQGPITRAQAWSTWFWLLLHATFCANTIGGTDPSGGRPDMAPWSPDGILYMGTSLKKKGW
jgi:hypothetical protein